MDTIEDYDSQRRPGGGRDLVPAREVSLDLLRPAATSQIGLDGQGQDEGNFAGSLRRYWHILLKRRWVILSITLAFVVLGGVRTFLKTPIYSATARIQIDREPSKVVEGGSTAPSEEGGSDFLRTQFELLKSRAMAGRVASSVRIFEDTEFLKARGVSPVASDQGASPALSPSALQEASISILMASFSVMPVPGSRLVDLTFSDTSADRAGLIANAYADAYIASTLDKRLQANQYAKTFLEDQLKQLKIRLEGSENALLQFAEREKMVEVTEKSSIAENNLAAANVAVGQLISERIKDEQLWQQVESSNAINLPQLLSNPVIEVLRGQRKALETEYQEKLENFKPGYPAMVQISNKLKEIDRQLAAEVKTVRNSLKARYESVLSQEKQMQARIQTLREEVLDLQKKGIQFNILKREVETNRGVYNSLLQRFKEVDIAGGVGASNVFLVDRATAPAFPTEPNIKRSLMLLLALGFGVAFGCALLLESFDDRVRAPEEIEQISGLSTLGIIPRIDAEDGLKKAIGDPYSAISEAYRSFATALQFSTEAGLPRSIAVTSAGPGEGKSTTVVAMGRHFSQMGLKVLLVDADMRKPSLHTKLLRDNAVGLSSYLKGEAFPPDVIQRTDNPRLAFMASGPLSSNAADLLSGPSLFSLISHGSEVFDLIVFDTPPLLGLADAPLVCSAAAATIFVVGAGDHRKGVVRSALRRLQLPRVTLLGAVLTKFDYKTVGYAYAYSHRYAYGYEYEHGAYSYAKPLTASPASRERGKLFSSDVS